MTPSAYMAQQVVLKALRDVPDDATWMDKPVFREMVNNPSVFQHIIAPKLDPARSRRIHGEDAYFRHIARIFEKFARQDKQDRPW